MSPVFALLLVCAGVILSSCANRPSDPVIHHGYAKGAVAAAWSPGGSRLALANSRRIWVYDANTLVLEQELFSGADAASGFEFDQRYGLGNSLAFLTENLLATTGMGGMVSIWDVETGARHESFDWPANEGYPTSLAWSETEHLLAAGTGSGAVMLMKPGSGAAPDVLGQAGGQVQAVRFGPHGDYLGAAGTGPEVVVWNVAQRAVAARIPARGTVMDIEPLGSPDLYLIAGDELEIWSLAKPVEGQSLANPELGGQAAGYGLATLAFATAAVLTAVSPVDAILLGAPTPTREATMACSRAVAVDPAGSLVADMHPGYMKETIRILDPTRNEVIRELNPRGAGTCDLEFSPDGTHLLIANQRGGHLYDARTWKVTRLESRITRPD